MITRQEMRKLINEWMKLYLGVASIKSNSDHVRFNGWKLMDFESAKKRIEEDFELMKGKN